MAIAYSTDSRTLLRPFARLIACSFLIKRLRAQTHTFFQERDDLLNSRQRHGNLLQIGTRLRKGLWDSKPDGREAPLRSELFSTEQMKQHGKLLAASHSVARGPASDHLLARLADNEKILKETCHLLLTAIKANRRIAPAGEWLLDNFYLIEQQIRTARRHLPKGYSQELPRLLKGPSAGLPRVYDLALEAISHGDARVDPESLSGFVEAYQTVTALKLGELWAIPIMLRLALIENLRRVAAELAAKRIDRNLADSWADKMTEVAEKDPKNLILVIADMARSKPPMVSSFIAELARRLQGQGPALALPLTWIEQRLSESGSTIEELVRSENQRQATDQVSIRQPKASRPEVISLPLHRAFTLGRSLHDFHGRLQRSANECPCSMSGARILRKKTVKSSS